MEKLSTVHCTVLNCHKYKKNRQIINILPILAGAVMQLLSFTGCTNKKNSLDTVKTAYIHKYGVEVLDEADFEARGGTGQVVKVQKNGVTIKQSYVKGVLEGVSSWSFPHRDGIQRVALFKNGDLVEETLHYISGTPQVKNCYSNKKIERSTSWYEDGSPRYLEEFSAGKLMSGKYYTTTFELESEVKDGVGVKTVRDGLGTLVSREQYELGELKLQTTFYANGSPNAQIPYVAGKIEGLKKVYFPGGEPKQTEEWKDGVLDGVVTLYENGARIALVPYKNGKKEGVEVRFKDNSSIIVEEISWQDDKKNGPSVAFVGGQKVTEWYYQDERVSKHQYLECISPAYLSKE